MSDATASFERPGSKADRKPSTIKDTGSGAALGMVVGGCHWAIKCYVNGHWHYTPPDDALVEVFALAVMVPLGRWIVVVISLIGDIVVEKLQRADRPQP